MKGTFKKGDVSEHFQEPLGRGIAFKAAAAHRQQNEGQIRPLLLVGQPRAQRSEIGGGQRFFRHHDERGAGIQIRDKLRERAAALGGKIGFPQNARRDDRVTASRRENERALRNGAALHGVSANGTEKSWPIIVGTPRRTP